MCRARAQAYYYCNDVVRSDNTVRILLLLLQLYNSMNLGRCACNKREKRDRYLARICSGSAAVHAELQRRATAEDPKYV